MKRELDILKLKYLVYNYVGTDENIRNFNYIEEDNDVLLRRHTTISIPSYIRENISASFLMTLWKYLGFGMSKIYYISGFTNSDFIYLNNSKIVPSLGLQHYVNNITVYNLNEDSNKYVTSINIFKDIISDFDYDNYYLLTTKNLTDLIKFPIEDDSLSILSTNKDNIQYYKTDILYPRFYIDDLKNRINDKYNSISSIDDITAFKVLEELLGRKDNIFFYKELLEMDRYIREKTYVEEMFIDDKNIYPWSLDDSITDKCYILLSSIYSICMSYGINNIKLKALVNDRLSCLEHLEVSFILQNENNFVVLNKFKNSLNKVLMLAKFDYETKIKLKMNVFNVAQLEIHYLNQKRKYLYRCYLSSITSHLIYKENDIHDIYSIVSKVNYA